MQMLCLGLNVNIQTIKYVNNTYLNVNNSIVKVSIISNELAKRTKFLLAVIYGSACRHSIRSKTFKKIGKCEIKMYDHFMTS